MQNNNNIVMISTDNIEPHPDNPRKELGDISELTASVKAKGIMQNLTVIPMSDEGGEGEKYRVIIGHRRLAAAKEAGMTKVPCVIAHLSLQEQIEVMLLENMQRADLTVYEQAQGFQMMMDFGDDIATVAEKTGFSESTVRRRIKLAELPKDILKDASDKQITIGELDRLSKIENPNTRASVLSYYGTRNYNNEYEKAISNQKNERNIARWRAYLSERGIKELPKDDLYSDKYIRCAVISIGEECSEADDVISQNKKLHFIYNEYSTIFLVSQKSKNAKQRAEDLKQQEALEKLKERRAALVEARDRAYTLRCNFIKNLTEEDAKKHFSAAVSVLIKLLTSDSIYGSFNGKKYAGYFEIEIENVGREKIYDVIWDGVKDRPYLALVLYAYNILGDGDHLSYVYEYNATYAKSLRLDFIYDYLCALGYEMSDEEMTLRDGTHPSFRSDE